MSRLDEIAEEIVMYLANQMEPGPLQISLWNEGPIEATFLIRAVIDGCQRQGLDITQINVCPKIGRDLLKQYGEEGSGCAGVKIEVSDKLTSEIEIHRFPVSD